MKRFVLLLVSGIFAVSALGKLLYLPQIAFSGVTLFFASSTIAYIVIVLIASVEIIFSVLVWLRVPKWLIVVPVLFAAVYGWSLHQGVNCGCFGALPLLGNLSPAAHFMLLAGMFLGLLYLSVAGKRGDKSEGERERAWLGATGYGAVGLIVAAVLPLPLGVFKSNPAPVHASGAAVTRHEVVAALNDSGTVVIDARHPLAFRLGHIPGAVNVPYNHEPLEPLVVQHGLRHRRVIVYCAGVHCNAAELLAGRLRKLGCPHVQVYAGGWEDWRRHLSGDG